MKSILFAIALLTFATAAAGQNSIKLFDPVPIGSSDMNVIMNASPYGMYKSAEVYLSCPTSGRLTSTISGPNGGNFIVDNVLMLNGENVCSGNCFSYASNPGGFLGMPAEMAYGGVSPVSVSREISGSGLYTFQLLDFGYTYASTAVYLNTNCSIIPIFIPPDEETLPGGSTVCHRNSGNGNTGTQTLVVGPAAVSSHLAHGDTIGACGQ